MSPHAGVLTALLQRTTQLLLNPGNPRFKRRGGDDKMIDAAHKLLHALIPINSRRRYLTTHRRGKQNQSLAPSITAVSDPAPNLPITENNLHSVLGTDGIQRLTAAFYRRIPTDDLLGPMYPPEDLQGAEERLRMFLSFRFGGPQDYLEKRGHPALRARHGPFAITQAARDRWMTLMNHAIDECGFTPDASDVLRRFLGHVATFLINR
jgi:hemoglobin